VKTVTITIPELMNACRKCCLSKDDFKELCTALGLTDPPKKTVKLLAYIDSSNLFWKREGCEFFGIKLCQRVPSQDMTVEVEGE